MATIEQALAGSGDLQPYKGMDVLRTTIIVTNAGDGLSQSMSIDPVELEIGSRHVLVLDVEVVEHKHRPIKDVDALELRQVLRASTATLAAGEDVRAMLAAQEERILRAREAAQGITRLEFADDGEDDEAEVHVRNHHAGSHADGLREGCPLCSAEADLVELGE